MTKRNKIKNFGYVSRMDNLQAAILNFRLKNLGKIINKRRINAKFYMNNLNKKFIFMPKENSNEFNTYHTFVIQVEKREELREYLFTQGIETAIHYPTPIHLQPAAMRLGYKLGDFHRTEKQAKMILTLPVNQNLRPQELKRICAAVNNFCN